LNTAGTDGFVYVRDDKSLESLRQLVATAARVAVDTEADSLHNYFEKVCLIQLSIDGAHFLVDPLAGMDLRGFLDALATKRLIFHAGDYDLRILRSSTGFRPTGAIFDTMIAAQLLGIEQIGLAALTLGRSIAIVTALCAVTSYGVLIYRHVHELVPTHHRLNDFPTHLFTIWLAATVAANLAACFIGRASLALRAREEALDAEDDHQQVHRDQDRYDEAALVDKAEGVAGLGFDRVALDGVAAFEIAGITENEIVEKDAHDQRCGDNDGHEQAGHLAVFAFSAHVRGGCVSVWGVLGDRSGPRWAFEEQAVFRRVANIAKARHGPCLGSERKDAPGRAVINGLGQHGIRRGVALGVECSQRRVPGGWYAVNAFCRGTAAAM